jgi:hypothetical protein
MLLRAGRYPGYLGAISSERSPIPLIAPCLPQYDRTLSPCSLWGVDSFQAFASTNEQVTRQ